MGTRKELGKIKAASYGFGGYQECQFGLSVTLGGEGWGVCDFWGFWGDEPSSYAKWTKGEQIECYGQTAARICELLKAAKARNVEELQDKPVEVTFNGMQLESWRILAEVL